ncbi:hypothetical protein BJX63DRAFT_127120 [Aspergillus granulosus]|uniref:Uncharacterized protein n=1 Tax=Aspergillus granulosus TaxID=176169 RepID=A0ABR4I4F2_9EURO
MRKKTSLRKLDWSCLLINVARGEIRVISYHSSNREWDFLRLKTPVNGYKVLHTEPDFEALANQDKVVVEVYLPFR